MVAESSEKLAQQLQAAFEARPYLFRPDFPFRTAARQLADACLASESGKLYVMLASASGHTRPE